MAVNRVRELRQRSRLTQDALAFRCRVTLRTAINWEKGEKHPTSRNARRLAKVLGVTVDDLGLGVPVRRVGSGGAALVHHADPRPVEETR